MNKRFMSELQSSCPQLPPIPRLAPIRQNRRSQLRMTYSYSEEQELKEQSVESIYDTIEAYREKSITPRKIYSLLDE